MKYFLEDYWPIVIELSFLVFLAAQIPGGVTIILMILGTGAVVSLVWFFWMHGCALQILIEIYSGKIQVKTKQEILIQPKFFVIEDADHEQSKVYKAQMKDEECQKVINYLMKHICFVEAYCNLYFDFPTGIRPVE